MRKLFLLVFALCVWSVFADAQEGAGRYIEVTQSVREAIRVVFHMPLMSCFVEFSFFQFIFFIFGSVFRIEEAHKRTVCYKRYDTFCFVVIEFQSSDPNEYNQDCCADQINT